MKVSAVLVGVNVAATLSVAAQHPAFAQDGRASSTADFLKSSLVETTSQEPVQLVAGPAQPLGQGRKVSMSDPRSVATRKALSAKGVKLRPFLANRKLPSKAEMDVALSPQTAAMDYSNQATTLDGGVSEYSPYYSSVDSYDPAAMSPRGKFAVKAHERRTESQRLKAAARVASTYTRPIAPRAVPGSMPAIPGRVGFPCAETPMQSMPMMAHPQQHQQQFNHPSFNQQQRFNQPLNFAQQPQQFNSAPTMGPTQSDEPMPPQRLSPQEQLEMNKLVETACLQNGVNPNAVGPAANDLYARIGPPPFPLSLIPGDAMKGFIKGARNRKSAIPGQAPMSFSNDHTSANLPSGGFRSYLRTSASGYTNFSRMPSAYPQNIQPISQTGLNRGKAHQNYGVKKSNAGFPAVKNEAMTYPPYKGQMNYGS
ncbi:MAG: hypothetical protein K2X93_06645 [Candidatus Obscuribacterales bacterium]|nr:hypothetical protein [Candidatus Obscuribacterales bacterium]